MTERAAIILAGGKARRFQSEQQTWQDKALIELSGKPLLVHAVENVQNLVEEIVISVNEESRKAKYSEVLRKYHKENVRLLVDEKCDQLGGPLVAILTGLKSVKADYCLTLPCDMPFVQPAVIEYMLDAARGSRVVVPMWPNGRLETLLMTLERNSALEVAGTLCNLQIPRSDDIVRGALNVLFVSTVAEIRTLDPDLRSFVNINSREDLSRLQPRHVQGPLTQNMRLNLGALPAVELRRLRDASIVSKTGDFSKASRTFASCARKLETERLFFWTAISRENECKTLLKGAKQQMTTEQEVGQVSSARKALLKAADNYGFEAEMYETKGYVFLAERAKSDKMWCESLAGDLLSKVS
jgi:molybdopterin-guanine dinucleotide biosynthesis protein A